MIITRMIHTDRKRSTSDRLLITEPLLSSAGATVVFGGVGCVGSVTAPVDGSR